MVAPWQVVRGCCWQRGGWLGAVWGVVGVDDFVAGVGFDHLLIASWVFHQYTHPKVASSTSSCAMALGRELVGSSSASSIPMPCSFIQCFNDRR